jgi:hypothetical protein
VKTIVLLKSEYFINQERKLEVRNYEFPVEKKSRFEREHRIEAKTIEVIHNLYDYYKKLMPQLYLNPNSVIKTVSNETKIKKGTVKKILSEEIVLPKKKFVFFGSTGNREILISNESLCNTDSSDI